MNFLGAVELSLRSPDYVNTIPMLLETVPVDVLTLFHLDVLDGYNLLADNVTNHMWNRVVTYEDPLEVRDEWSVPQKRIDAHQYIVRVYNHTDFYRTQVSHCSL